MEALAGSIPSDKLLGLLKDLLEKILKGVISLYQLELFVQGKNPFEDNAFTQLIKSCRDKLSSKLRQKAIVPQPPAAITEDLMAKLAAWNMQVAYLPDLNVTEKFSVRRWVKPESWFYQQMNASKISESATLIKGGWYAFDVTPFVDYTDGTQMIPNDPLANLLARLRQEGKIVQEEKIPSGSRFGISWEEWTGVVAPAFAAELGLKAEQVRLEAAVEFNAIGNIYDANRGKFNVWQWFNDIFDSSDRLRGGRRDFGGLADVYHVPSGLRHGNIAGRLLVSFQD